jgi:hypothetical protein
LDLSAASAAAAFAVFFAKENATGCGKKTRMALVIHGRALTANQAALQKLDDIFADYSDCERFTRNRLLGMPTQEPFQGMDDRLNNLRHRIREAADDLWPQLKPSIPQTSPDQQ